LIRQDEKRLDGKKLAVFQRTPLFSKLAPEDRALLAGLAVEKRFAAGETLFYEGTPCEGLYVIGDGSVKITKTSGTGREIMLAIESAPNSVAEVPLFDDGNYPATVVAVTDCLTYLLRREDFRRFCGSHPEVPIRMLTVVGQRLRQLVSLIEAVTFGSVRQRVAGALLQAAEADKTGSLSVNLTHEELALRLGTVREVVSRNIARFQAEGYLRVVRRQIVVLDREGLAREAETEF
jgi:CRP/FNR family transcriptional regulator